MHQAVYFCLADFDIQEVFHYGLAVPLYTHFTSPIRRYADVLVHRLLAAAIDIQSLTNEMTDKFKMARQCDQMNRKNRMAQLASQASVQFNTFLFFKNQMAKQPDKELLEEAIVMKVTKAGVYVMVKAYGIEGFLTEVPPTHTVSVDLLKETATLDGKEVIQTFDSVVIQIMPVSVEFRRQLQFLFRHKVDRQADIKMKEDKEINLADAKMSKKHKKKNKKKQME